MIGPIDGAVVNIRNMPCRLTEWERAAQRSLSKSSALQARSPFQTERAGMAYGKEEAIRDAWGDRMRIDLTGDGSERALLLTMRCGLSANPYESMAGLMQLSEKGLDGSVNWSGVSSDFSQVGRSANGENLKETIDYFASRYVTLESQLIRTNTGQELEDQLDQLEEVFSGGARAFAASYAVRLKQALNLSEEAAQRAETSLNRLIAQRISDYREVQKSLDISFEPEEQWLQNHDKFMAARLRQAAKEAPAGEADTDFTLTDLRWASEIAGSYQTLYASASGGGKHHTEFYVLTPALADMKTEVLADSGILSRNMSAALRDSMENRHKRLAEIAHASGAAQGTGSDSSFDCARFQDVYSRILGVFHQTGDAVRAIGKGAAYIQETARGIAVSYRFADFFAPSGYGGNGSRMSAYQSSWEAFQRRLETQKGAIPPAGLGGIPPLCDSQFVDVSA